MDKVLDGIDFSEIINEEDDSCAFVDSNILESARQELEQEKSARLVVEKRPATVGLQPINERNDEHKSTNAALENDNQALEPPKEPVKHHHSHKCGHDGIKPVFDCIYCAKSNFVVEKLIHKTLANKYKETDMVSLELSIKSKKFDNLATSTMPNLFQSTAVSTGNARTTFVNKNDECKFYSMSNSIAKIKFEKAQNTFDDPKIAGLPGVMRSMLEQSKLMNTHISPSRVLKKHLSSNLTTIGLLDKVMRSCSVYNPKVFGDTKLMGTKYNFEDIDEDMNSESNKSSQNHFIEDKEQSNTSLERDIINISAIEGVKKRKKTKKEILEQISFETSHHDIYNPDFSCVIEQEEEPETPESLKSELKQSTIQVIDENNVSLSKQFLGDYEISLRDQKPKTKQSPFRIKKKTKIRTTIDSVAKTNTPSFLSRNVSQTTAEKEHSSKRRKNNSRIGGSGKKRKIRITRKKKQPYTYIGKKHSRVKEDPLSSNIEQRKNSNFNEQYFARNDSLFSSERLILASSSKKNTLQADPHVYDFSTLESGRLKSSYLQSEANLRSAASIIPNEISAHSLSKKHRLTSQTPVGGNKNRSSSNFRKIVSTYSSKLQKRSSSNLVPWSNSMKALPKQSNRYCRVNTNKMLAQAYKSIPKEAVLSKKNMGSRRGPSRKQNRIPPASKHHGKDDQTLCLLLKHMRSDTNPKLPKVVSQGSFKTSTDFNPRRKSNKKATKQFTTIMQPNSLGSTQVFE